MLGQDSDYVPLSSMYVRRGHEQLAPKYVPFVSMKFKPRMQRLADSAQGAAAAAAAASDDDSPSDDLPALPSEWDIELISIDPQRVCDELELQNLSHLHIFCILCGNDIMSAKTSDTSYQEGYRHSAALHASHAFPCNSFCARCWMFVSANLPNSTVAWASCRRAVAVASRQSLTSCRTSRSTRSTNETSLCSRRKRMEICLYSQLTTTRW
jgi:hypothetical protein